jgi:hypothetical protein
MTALIVVIKKQVRMQSIVIQYVQQNLEKNKDIDFISQIKLKFFLYINQIKT